MTAHVYVVACSEGICSGRSARLFLRTACRISPKTRGCEIMPEQNSNDLPAVIIDEHLEGARRAIRERADPMLGERH
jgi:hypothetical protein